MTSPALDAPAVRGDAVGRGPAASPGSSGSLCPLGQLDLFSDDFIRGPYPWLDVLRAEAPVHFDAPTGLWLVSRYRDVRHVLLDPELFRPDNAQHAVSPLPVAVLRVLARAGFSLPPALANNATASHPELRRLVTRFFDARRVATCAPMIERIAEELLDTVQVQVEDVGGCDLFSSFAQILPCRVLTELLGIQGTSLDTLIRWSDASLELFWGRPGLERQLELAELVGDFHEWLAAMIRGRSAPVGSFVETLSRYRLPDGTVLDVETAVAACFFVFIAGQSTTGQLIGTVLRRALAEPGLWSRVAQDEGLAEAWVEEVLRREPPVTTWRRVCARSTELAGVLLPSGAQLLLMLMGSGSDPAVFTKPEQMVPNRANVRRHLAFGVGRHRCPGASLARAEAATALRVAARILPGVRPAADAEPPPMLGLLSFRAPLRVAVRQRDPLNAAQ